MLRGKRWDVVGALRHTPALPGWLNALGAGQHGLVWRDIPGASRPGSAAEATEACRALFESFGNCVLKMLAEGVSSARLETRTKESNVYASWWVEHP